MMFNSPSAQAQKQPPAMLDYEVGNELWAWKPEKDKKERKSELLGMQDGTQVDVVDLSYSVLVNKKSKQLLNGVSFSLEAGDMCAIMGPSGAGKR